MPTWTANAVYAWRAQSLLHVPLRIAVHDANIHAGWRDDADGWAVEFKRHPAGRGADMSIQASGANTQELPALVIDGNPLTRWSTGQDENGSEWLQLDFGAYVSCTD